MQRLQVGFASSHLTCLFLHVTQPLFTLGRLMRLSLGASAALVVAAAAAEGCRSSSDGASPWEMRDACGGFMVSLQNIHCNIDTHCAFFFCVAEPTHIYFHLRILL